jgi:DNA-binding MarR family transcriptional regulator
MTGSRIRHGMVILVVLALGLSVATPAVAGPDDTTTDGTFGGGLDGSSTNSTSDSGDSRSSDDGAFSDDSGSDSRSSDDGAFSDDSSDGSSDSSEDTELSLAERTDKLGGMDLGTLPSDDFPDGVSKTELVDVDSTTSGGTSETTGYEIELVKLSPSTDPVLEVYATGGATTSTVSTVGSLSSTYDTVTRGLTSGSSSVTDATVESARYSVDTADTEPTAPDTDGPAAIEPRDADSSGDGSNDAPQNALGVRMPTDGLPGGPAGGGAALGALGLAAAVIARQTGAFGGLTTGLATSMQTAASSVPGSSRLSRLVRMLAPFRYSRYDDSDPLEHEARDAMFAVVEESPGTYLSEIADRADLPLSTARHHIRVLEREDLVSGAKVRGKRRFYPAYTEGVELAAAMNDDSTAAVIDALARIGAASVSDLADELGKDPSTVTHHVQRLEEDGVIVRERDGRAVINKLSAAARTALEPEEAPVEGPTAGEAMASD